MQRPHSNNSHIPPHNFKPFNILSQFASWFAFEHLIIKKTPNFKANLCLPLCHSQFINFSFNFSFLLYKFPLRKIKSYLLKSNFKFSFSMHLYVFGTNFWFCLQLDLCIFLTTPMFDFHVIGSFPLCSAHSSNSSATVTQVHHVCYAAQSLSPLALPNFFVSIMVSQRGCYCLLNN